jgi:hypothetical protein
MPNHKNRVPVIKANNTKFSQKLLFHRSQGKIGKKEVNLPGSGVL